MAVVQLGAIVSNIRGSVAGTTFQRSGSGLTMRSKPVAVGQGTFAQQNIRNINSRLNFEWFNLSDVQRSTWASFSSYTNGIGKTNRQNNASNTGKTQFFAVNFWCLQYGKPIIASPTFSPPPSVLIACPPLFTEASTLMNYVGYLDTTSQILVTRVSLPQSLATNTANTGFRSLVYAQIDGDTQDWADAYESTFGIPLEVNKKYWVSLQVVDYIKGTISPESRQLILLTPYVPHGIGSDAVGSTFKVG